MDRILKGAKPANLPIEQQMARDFEVKLRAAGKPVEAVYYEGGQHNDIFTSSTQYRDEVQDMLTFLRRHLRE